MFSKRESSPVVGDEDLAGKQDSDFEDTKDEEANFEAARSARPKKKRARTAQTTQPVPRKKQTRGKQGRLAGLMQMPIDIFTEIAAYLMPKDIITLSRSSRFFRKLLLSKSAIHIWHGSMRNVPGLPPCPPDMSEPHYLALIYAHNCSFCGTTVNRRMDELLRVRLCPSCRDESLVEELLISTDIRSLVLRSNKIMPSKRRWGYDYHALHKDATTVQAIVNDFEKSGDSVGLEKWKASREKEIETRRTQARELMVFLDALESDREAELANLKQRRRDDINNRLLEIGWQKEDLVFRYPRSREWSIFVDQPKVLTDRTWANLRPKLIPLLEANREDRLERERAQRKRERKARLTEYIRDLKSERQLVIDASINPQPTTNSTPTTSDNTPPNVLVKHAGLFPDIADALEWEEMKQLLEEDLPVEIMATQVEPILPQIAEHATAWIHDIESRLVELIRKGHEEDGLGRDVPDAVFSCPKNPSTDLLQNAGSNMKILLRADSFFESPKTGSRVPLVYDALVLNSYPPPAFYHFSVDSQSSKSIDMTKFKRHAAAQRTARMLLAYLGKPNATFLEMRSAGQMYKCGRCHERGNFTWEEMVHHFVLKEQVWENVQRQQAELNKKGIVFRNVHDPAFVTGKPLVKLLTKDELVAETTDMFDSAAMQSCKVCSRSGVLPNVRAKQEAMIAHLVDVHNIPEPKSPDHYEPAFHPGFLGYLLDTQIDPYDDPELWGQSEDWSDDDEIFVDFGFEW
ncbi:hypothetical protein RhiJN_00016 [Ceratobasidium sp. AG-Ba]|nr:hypothetical protein RhiJN_00016 [Ceratobasidium sp. AG-Ba]